MGKSHLQEIAAILFLPKGINPTPCNLFILISNHNPTNLSRLAI